LPGSRIDSRKHPVDVSAGRLCSPDRALVLHRVDPQVADTVHATDAGAKLSVAIGGKSAIQDPPVEMHCEETDVSTSHEIGNESCIALRPHATSVLRPADKLR